MNIKKYILTVLISVILFVGNIYDKTTAQCDLEEKIENREKLKKK
jgi:hypothetical protein